jgi:hypothetical protein
MDAKLVCQTVGVVEESPSPNNVEGFREGSNLFKIALLHIPN